MSTYIMQTYIMPAYIMQKEVTCKVRQHYDKKYDRLWPRRGRDKRVEDHS